MELWDENRNHTKKPQCSRDDVRNNSRGAEFEKTSLVWPNKGANGLENQLTNHLHKIRARAMKNMPEPSHDDEKIEPSRFR
jgi:hypothetical protein